MQNKSITNRSIIFLLIIISLVILAGCRSREPLEIIVPQAPKLVGEVYIGGAVSVPGDYPLRSEDTIEALIQSAGGINPDADLNHLRLYIPESGEEEEPQKIDLNRAETWLLEALPEIGESLAIRIVDYRGQKGPFRNVRELTRVEGIGAATLDKIENLITVSD